MSEENATLEPQEELEEINQEIENGQQEHGDEQEERTVNEKSPEYKAGMEAMKKSMQEAFNTRISKIIGKSKAEINSIRQEFAAQLAEVKQSMVKQDPVPKLADYESEEEWADAFFDHKQKQARPQKQAPKQQSYQSPAEAQFAVKEQEYEAKHPGYYARVRNLIPFIHQNPAIADGIFTLDPVIADKLSGDLEKVEELIGLTPAQIGVKLARYEDAIKRDQSLPKKAKPKPAPGTEQRGTSSSANALPSDREAYYKMRWKMDHPD